jgi:hypothetical protein
VSAQGGAERARLVASDLSAPSLHPDDGDGTDRWDEWYRRDYDRRTLAQAYSESPRDKMRRAFLAGWSARDTGPDTGESLGYVVIFRQHSAAEIRSWLAGCDVLTEGDAARAAVEAEDHTPFEAVVCELRAVDRDAALRRAAADELTALTEDLGLYDDGTGS